MLHVAVLTISNAGSNAGAIAGDELGLCVLGRLQAAGHRLVDRDVVNDDDGAIRGQLGPWLADREIDVVIAVGGSGRFGIHALGVEITRTVPGFSELARMLAFQAVGGAAILARAEVCVCRDTLVVVLAGPTPVIDVAIERLLVPQLDEHARPSLVALLPRARVRTPTLPPAAKQIALAPIAVPTPIPTAAPPIPRPAVMTTGSIATIGDLPPSAAIVAFPNRPRREPLAILLGLVATAAAGALVFGVARIRESSTEATDSAAEVAPKPVVSPVLSHPSPPPAPVAHAVAAAPAKPTRVAAKRPVAGKPAAARVAVVDEPPALASPPPPPTQTASTSPLVDRGCDEVSCALENYDRLCCAPYKQPQPPPKSGLPETLDRGMIATALDPIKPVVVQCGERIAVHGVVKVHVDVDSGGAVSGIDVRDAPDDALGACVASAVHRARFVRTDHGGSFTYPYSF